MNIRGHLHLIECFMAFIIMLILCPQAGWAYTDGQFLVKDGITYRITSVADFTVQAVGTTLSGKLEIPATVSDGDATFTVTRIQYARVTENDGSGRSWHFSNITELILPNTITYIGEILYGGGFKTLHIPTSVKEIHCFQNGNGIPNIVLDGENANFVVDDKGILYDKDKTTLYAVPSSVTFDDGTFSIPSTVKTINSASLRGNKSIKKLVIPASVSSIPTGWPTIAPGCSNLKEIEVEKGNTKYYSTDGNLALRDGNKLLLYPVGRKDGAYKVPDDIKALGGCAFLGSLITSLDLNNVTSLESNSIWTCGNLISITIGASLSSISQGAIPDCGSLTTITVDAGNANYESIDGVVFTKGETNRTLLLYPGGKTATEYSIPDGTIIVGNQAFYGQRNLTSITVPTTVTTIKTSGFRGIRNLNTVTFTEPSSVKTLESNTFWGDNSLKTITMPSSLEKLNGSVFLDCNSLEEVIFPDNSKLSTIEGSALNNLKSLKKVTFQGSSELKTISSNAFSYNTSLEEITLPTSVTNIESNAFQGCTKLTTVNFGDNPSITKFGAGAFANCGITRIDVPTSVTTIESSAFENCSGLTAVNLSAGVTSVSAEAFKGCTNLGTFTVDEGNANYSAVNGYLLNKDKSSLLIFPPAKASDDVTLLPPSLTSIGDYAFYQCENLTNIVIPQKVTKIGNRAFGMCDKLTYVTFLCDAKIESTNVGTPSDNNKVAFDNGKNRTDKHNAFINITISVREPQYSDYSSDNFYKQFKGIETYFSAAHEGDKNKAENADQFWPMSDKAVMLLRTNANVPVYVASTSVINPNDESKRERQVSMVSDYAFDGANVEEVVFRNNIHSLGAMAFITKTERKTENGNETVTPVSSTIKDIVFCGDMPSDFQTSTKDFDLSTNYNEFLSSQKIYVRKSQLDKFKEALPNFKDQISYQLPGITISNRYGTFAREFDTDLSEYFNENASTVMRVAAFTAYVKTLKYTAADNTTTYAIRLESIDKHGGKDSDYGYIPANTGVMLKVLLNDKTRDGDVKGVTTPDGYWYAIGEEQGEYDNKVTDNAMHGVTVNSATLTASSDVVRYALKGGKFHPLNYPYTISAHKAYLELPSQNASAKVVLQFDDGTTTGIEEIGQDINSKGVDTPIYNLQGQQVRHPHNGVFIKAGKKIVVK